MDYRIEFNTIKHTQQPGRLVIMLDGPHGSANRVV